MKDVNRKPLFFFLLICVIMFPLLLPGCGTPSESVRYVLHDYLVYDGRGISVHGLSWNDSPEKVKEARQVSQSEILEDSTAEGKNYTCISFQSQLWADKDGTSAVELYSFGEKKELSFAQLEMETSSAESASSILEEIVRWAKDCLPAPDYTNVPWTEDTDTILDSYFSLESGTAAWNYWEASDESRLDFQVFALSPDGIMKIYLDLRTPYFDGSDPVPNVQITDSPASDTADSNELPNYFAYYTDGRIFIRDLDWWISWEDVKALRYIQPDALAAENGTENYVKSSLWSDIEGCDVQEVYCFTEENQLYSGGLTVKASTREGAQAILTDVVNWAKDYLPPPLTNPGQWTRDTQVIVDEFLNLASGTSQRNIWEMKNNNSLHISVTSFEPLDAMIIDISATAPKT